MATMNDEKVVIVKQDTMTSFESGTSREVFLQTADEFGGLDIMHTLLLHEARLRNNLNASRFMGRMLDQDYDNACRRAGAIINRQSGRTMSFVSYNQINRIKD